MKTHSPDPTKKVPAFIPENFDADRILDGLSELQERTRHKLKAGMYFILDSIHNLSLNREYQDQFERYGGYPLNAKLLQGMIGNDMYKRVLDLLVENGVIVRGDNYTPGVRAKLVNLTPRYGTALIKTREFPPGIVKKKVLEYRNKKEKENETSLSAIPYITRWFDPNQLQMDEQRAHQFIEFYGSQMKKHIPTVLPKNWTRAEINTRIDLRVNNMLSIMRQYYTGDLRLTKTGNDHRLHSVLSATKKELRSLFTYNGEPLYSLDLKASQPYLLNCLTQYEFYDEKKEKGLKALLPEITTEMKGVRIRKELNDILLMFLDSHTTHAGKGSRASGFSKIHWDDDFYAHLVQKAQAEGKSSVFPDRQTVKKRMMQILYNTEIYADKDPGFVLFKNWFPAEAALISFFKKVSRCKKKKSEAVQLNANIARKSLQMGPEILNYLPVLLQRLESYLMLEQVCKAISIEYPDAPLLTIHDCILTTEGYHKQVKAVMERELVRLTGVVPGVSVDIPNNDVALKDLVKLATDDIKEILKKKTEKELIGTGRKSPLVYEIPRFGPIGIFSTRYVDPNQESLHSISDYGDKNDPSLTV